MYAVVETGGKQFRVQPGDTIRVEKLPHQVGDVLDLGRVLFFCDGDNVRVGSPVIPGAVVRTEVVDNGRGKKIVVFKYRSKVRYRKKTGHRQSYTALAVREILVNSGE